ncbi:8-oxoguanine DNA glycosylase [Peptoniphilus sp. ING2-D1G]|nr:8-oxoguanine DNA glycosylase [Peptoniphilus sp. ING2-D1G]
MDLKQKGEDLIIEDIDFFDVKDIFNCGQAFRAFKEEDGSYTNVAYGKIINISNEADNVTIKNSSIKDFYRIWLTYFDILRDYKELRESLSFDSTLVKAMEYGRGIRILNQEPFETIITFIISANNGIDRIKKSVDMISRMYGSKIGDYRGREYFSFPSPQELSLAKAEDLREYARVGFRDKRIVETAKMIMGAEIAMDDIHKIPIEEARAELMKLPGVGPKVADCVLLFAFKRSESFPVDVWIKRVMEELYLHESTPKSKIAEAGRKIFGDKAGFAQQYLFYYGRENKLGKE